MQTTDPTSKQREQATHPSDPTRAGTEPATRDDERACCASSCCGGDASAAAAAPARQAAPAGDAAGGDPIREHVRERYGAIAAREVGGCCGAGAWQAYAAQLGYGEEELALIPEAANLGLGCGNPTAIAALQPGEVVVDLGAGAGMDAFLAAARVTARGRVIGVDMTPAMLARARRTAVEQGVAGFVEFREGLIEALPVVSESVDVVISNCVINLSTDKPQVFREAWRVLRPGGRLAVSDICLSQPLPPTIAAQADAYAACVGGAILADDYLAALRAVGFADITWTRVPAAALLEVAAAQEPILGEALEAIDAGEREALADTIWSYRIEARKPEGVGA